VLGKTSRIVVPYLQEVHQMNAEWRWHFCTSSACFIFEINWPTNYL